MQFVPLEDLPSFPTPPFTLANIITAYSITIQSYRLVTNNKAANDFKNMDKKVFPWFRDGHIKSIKVSLHA